MAEVLVKVDVTRAKDPIDHVRGILRGIATPSKVHVEEVFPGLRTGHSAGLLTVQLPYAADSPQQQSCVKALEGNDAVLYVQEPKRRRRRVR